MAATTQTAMIIALERLSTIIIRIFPFSTIQKKNTDKLCKFFYQYSKLLRANKINQIN